ncbi:hypothetical protein MNBD_CHLOROFLEXI01-3686 [hydrothermal vent metagenome]|uniref:Glycosyltransferase RgtA/B/C/D-like domain-containing protein n=1 Tax=hydrothermal vent metagenome TaxID=652676 RepID=A0A3B0VC25_9ZZZZ
MLLLIIILLPGVASWLAFGYRLKAKLRGLEILFLSLLSGTAIVSWTSLTLAEFEVFSLPLLVGLTMGLSVLIIGWCGWNGRLQHAFSKLPWSWQDLAVGVLLLIAVLLSGRPSEYIIGGRDHGVYVNTGIHIAKSGGIVVRDDDLTAVPAELQATLVWPETRLYQAGFPGPWSEGQRISGLTIRDLDAGIYLPHAFHLYPALIALFFAVGGVPMALFTTMFLSLLGSLAIFVTITRLFNKIVGLLTLLLLTFSVTQVWFTGYPTAEIMVQPFFWGGLFAVILLLEYGGRYTAVLAGSCLGLLHLTKLDMVHVPIIFGILFIYLWLRQQFKPAYWWGAGIYLILSLQALLHASFIATIYFLDHAVRNLLPSFIADAVVVAADGYPYPSIWIRRFTAVNWPFLLLAGVLLLAGGVILKKLRPQIGQLLEKRFKQPQRWQQGIVVGLLIMVGGTAVSNQFPEISFFAEPLSAIHLTRLYLTRIGLLVGTVGWLLLIYRSESTIQRIIFFAILGMMSPLYILGAGTSPDHFWTIRRFLPIAFPALLMATAWLIWFIWPSRQMRPQSKWPRALLSVGLLAIILAGFLQHIRFIARVVEYDGLTAQLNTLAQELPDNAVLLLQAGTQVQQLDLPLWFLFDKSVFSIRGEVREDVLLETAVSYWQNNDRPVYWIGTAETPPPVWQDWEQQLQFTHQISVPKMETPLGRIPHQVEQFQLQLDIYELVKP